MSLAGAILGWIVRAWLATLRVSVFVHPSSGPGRRVIALWHEGLLPALAALRGAALVALVSRSRDGQLAAAALARLGVRCARGSSSRGGAAATRALLAALADGADVAVTVDGPRGPRRTAKPGAAFLAARSGARLVPLGIAASSGLRLRSWDGAVLPWPFSRVSVVVAAPTSQAELAAALDAAELEAERRLAHPASAVVPA